MVAGSTVAATASGRYISHVFFIYLYC